MDGLKKAGFASDYPMAGIGKGISVTPSFQFIVDHKQVYSCIYYCFRVIHDNRETIYHAPIYYKM